MQNFVHETASFDTHFSWLDLELNDGINLTEFECASIILILFISGWFWVLFFHGILLHISILFRTCSVWSITGSQQLSLDKIIFSILKV